MNTSSNVTLCELTGSCWKEAVTLMVFTIWAILDNLLVLATNGGTIIIIYMHRYDMLDIPTNIFICCLTLGDLVSVLALPFVLATSYVSYSWGWTISCFLTLWVSMISALVNAVTLCLIAVDRLIFIIYPLEYHTKMPVNRACNIAYSIWVFATMYSLIAISLGYTDAYQVGTIAHSCHSSFSIRGFSQQLLFYPFIVFVPITIGCYIKVGLVALQQRRIIAAEGSAQALPVGVDFKITKVMLNVITVYLLCTLVVIVTPLVLRYVHLEKDTREILFKVQIFVWRMNTWLNPLIYAWKSEKFRKYVRRTFNRSQEHTANVSIIMH